MIQTVIILILLNFCFPIGDHFEWFLGDSLGFYFQLSKPGALLELLLDFSVTATVCRITVADAMVHGHGFLSLFPSLQFPLYLYMDHT